MPMMAPAPKPARYSAASIRVANASAGNTPKRCELPARPWSAPMPNEAPACECGLKPERDAFHTPQPPTRINATPTRALAVSGNRVERQLLADEQQQARDQQHADGVADAPLQPRSPPFDSKSPRFAWRHLAQGRCESRASGDRRKMIGTGEDVKQACRQPREEGKRHRWIDFSWKNSSIASGPISRPMPDFL